MLSRTAGRWTAIARTAPVLKGSIKILEKPIGTLMGRTVITLAVSVFCRRRLLRRHDNRGTRACAGQVLERLSARYCWLR